MGCHALLQGIFPIQGLNPSLLHLLHCRQILYCLSHKGSPDKTQIMLIFTVLAPFILRSQKTTLY